MASAAELLAQAAGVPQLTDFDRVAAAGGRLELSPGVTGRLAPRRDGSQEFSRSYTPEALAREVGPPAALDEASLPTPERVRASVAQASAGKIAAMGGNPGPNPSAAPISDADAYRFAAGRATGAGQETMTPVEADLARLTPAEILGKYGEDEGGRLLMQSTRGAQSYGRDVSGSRTMENIASDAVSDLGLGVAGTIGGIGALVASGVSSELGVSAAQGLNALTRAVQGTQSSAQQGQRRASEAVSALNERTNSAQYEADVAGGRSTTSAGLARIGRGILNGADELASNPTMLGSAIAQGGGSLLLAGPLGKGIAAVGETLVPQATRRGIALAAEMETALGTTGSAAQRVAAVGRAAPSSTSVGIGLMEAGGSYSQSAAEVAGMSFEELEAKSPYYRSLREQNVSPEDARNRAASRAGQLAAALTAPAAMAAGGLVSRFESAPLRVPTIGSALGNMGREFVEEGLQSGAGSLAQNAAIQRIGDSSRVLSQGVGEQIAQGAIAGLGTAGAIQAPGMVGAAARATGAAAISAVENAANSVRDRNDAASPVSESRVREAADTVAAAAPQVEPVLRAAVEEATANATPEAKQEANSYIDNLVAANQYEPTMLEGSGMPETLAPVLDGAKDTLDVMNRLAGVLRTAKEGQSNQEIGWASSILNALSDNFLTVASSDPEAMRALPEDHPARQAIKAYGQLYQDIQDTPQIKRALARAKGVLSNVEVAPIPEASLSTPEGQRNVQIATAQASVAPEKGNLEVVDQILAHASSGKLKLSASQYAALLTSQAILSAMASATRDQQELGHKTPMRSVAEQVQTGTDRKTGKVSALTYTNDIFQAMRRNDTQGASTAMLRFGEFVEHMENKAKAVNNAVTKGVTQGIPFRALNPTTREWYTGKTPQIHGNSPKSVELAQTITLEAKRLADIYNNMGKAFPALKVKPRKLVPMSRALQGTPQQVVERSRTTRTSTDVRPVQAAQERAAPEVRSPVREAAPAAPAPKVETPVAAPAPAPTVEAKPVAKVEPKPAPKAEPAAKVEAKPVVQPSRISDAGKSADVVKIEASAVSQNEETKAVESAGTTESDTQTEAAAPKGTASAYPKLTPKSQFARSYNLPKTIKSRLLGTETPISVVREALSSPASLKAFTGIDADLGLDRDVARAYRAYIDQGMALGGILEDRMNAFLQKNSDRILRGEDVVEWANGKVVSLLDEKDGKLSYNRELVDGAILAGLQWLLTANQSESRLTEEGVAAIAGLSLDDMQDVDNLIAQMEGGMFGQTAKRSLAQKIRQFWGLTSNSETPAGFVEGIPEAIAAELLEAMVANGDLEPHQVTITERHGLAPGEILTPKFYATTRKNDREDPLLKAPSLLEKAILTTPEDVNYFGTDRPQVAKTQLRNPLVKNTPEQQEMISRAQNTPHFLHAPMLKLYQVLDKENILRLLAAGETKDKPWNRNHLASLDGQRRTVAAGFEYLMSMVPELEASAKAAGVSMDQHPIHYAYNVTRVGRLMMLGRYNPQSTKLVREVILPTRAELNLSDRNSEHFQMFALGLAQALGVKVHKQTLARSIDDVMALLEGKFSNSVEMMRDVQALGTADGDALTDVLLADFKKAKEPVTAIALHALTEYARYVMADEAGKKAFTTSLYVEADGVTNGAINAMSLLTSGTFTPEWIKRMKKGGLFFRGGGQGPATLNDLHSFDEKTEGGDKRDMYQSTTDALDQVLGSLSREAKSPEAANQVRLLRDLMDEFMPDFSVNQETNTIEMKRGIAKNPLTITLYGSGEKGIAGKVVGAMLDSLYERMSDAAQRMKADPELRLGDALFGSTATDKLSAKARETRFLAAFEGLTENIVARSKKGNLYLKTGETVPDITGINPETFTVEGNRLKNLQANALHLFVKPLRQAIEQTVGQELIDSTVLLRQATQVQGLFQQQAFAEGILEAQLQRVRAEPRIAELKLSDDKLTEILSASGLSKDEQKAFIERMGITAQQLGLIRRVRNQGLSAREQEAILKSVIKRMPLIDTGTQIFFPAGSQSTDLNTSEFGKSLTGSFDSPGYVYGPTDPRVAGIPFMVIGTGDGQAIQSLVTGPQAPEGALYIYDGVNFKLTTLKADSVKANQAIYDSWQGNPLRSVLQAYQASLPSMKVGNVSDAMKKTLVRALGLDPEDVQSPAVIQKAMDLLRSNLERSAIEVEARHKVMAKVSHNIDQMASAAAPYEHKGIDLQGTTDAEIAAELDVLYQVELAALKKRYSFKEVTPPAPVVQEVAPAPVAQTAKPVRGGKSLEQIVRELEAENAAAAQAGAKHSSGVRIYKHDGLARLTATLGLSPTQSAIFDQIQISGAAKGYTIIHGSVDQLSAYATATGAKASTQGKLGSMTAGDHGFLSVGDKTIYLVSPTAETLIHELIHAASYETVANFYAGKEERPEVKAAIQRLIELKDQFNRIPYPEGLKTLEMGPYADAYRAMKRQEKLGNHAAELNEFMAWGLANSRLNDVLGRTDSYLVRLAKDIVASIKTLFFGTAPMPVAGKDLLSNLLFNTSIVVNAQSSVAEQASIVLTHTSSSFGYAERLVKMGQTFNKVIGTYLDTNPVDKLDRENLLKGELVKADYLGDEAIAQGFDMNAQEKGIFSTMVATLATEAAIDPSSMAMAQTLFSHVLKNLDVGSMAAEGETDPNELALAQDRVNFLRGSILKATDTKGRSSMLPVFLALSMVHEPLRDALSRMPLPKSVLSGWNTLDGVIENAGNIAMDSLSQRLSNTQGSKSVQDAVDALSLRIREIAADQQGLIDRAAGPAGSAIDWANTQVSDLLQSAASAGVRGAEKLEARFSNRATKFLASSARVTEAIVNEDKAELVAKGISTTINGIKGFKPFTEFVTQMIGRTDDNKNVYDLMKEIRSDVQQDRQQYREHLPTVIAGKFSKKLTDAQWGSLFRGMGKSDLAALETHLNWDQILDLLEDPKSLASRVSTLEAYLQKTDPGHASMVQDKARQLARYMNTGIAGTNLLRNAEAVSKLLGERTQRNRPAVDKAFIDGVDQLTTLYALQGLEQSDKDSLAELVGSERKGMEFTLAYLVGQRTEEVRKAAYGPARLNHFKGHVPSMQQDGVSLLVAEDSRSAELAEMSYVRVGTYLGSAAEGLKSRRSYYFAPVSAKTAFNQGIAQNVHQTVSGVEANTGFSTGMTAGRITNPVEVERITRSMARQGGAVESLMPVYNAVGEVFAYERSVDPAQLNRLNQDTHLARMIGVWRGRQVEELKAQEFNRKLIDQLHAMWTKDSKKLGAKDQYVDLFDPKQLDAVQRDAVGLVSNELWDYAKDKFGESFYVRRDMFNDAFGYRNASVGDAWTGNSRLPPAMQKGVKNLALAAFGNKAYQYTMNTEQEWQSLIRNTKLLIAVKSVVVPMANFTANIYQMIGRGVPFMTIMRSMPKKLSEIHSFTQGRLRQIEAEAELRAADVSGDVIASRKLKGEIQTLKDSYRRMSIWPLIEAGEFTAISDNGISRDELLLTGGKLHQYVERLMDKLPGPLQTAGRYAVVGKDTALFQGLEKAVQYSDFIAKSIVYDDLVGRQKKDVPYALGRVKEEFVDYDRLGGRSQGYMESMGILWFPRFKIRSAKIALSMIRHNPIHALLSMALPAPSGTGTPLTDNLFSKGLTGSLGHSIGPGMAFGSWHMNPWVSLVR